MSHTIHIASVAYNSVFLGEFMLPDWDMFHSLHPAAEYHASARALSGGPVYVRCVDSVLTVMKSVFLVPNDLSADMLYQTRLEYLVSISLYFL